eukprot:CAMPEP_0184866268 /NCGR_PEP_ID=MMETSP0580-20130426/21602_1 /TAXON_ID=1118495 /ORGANISM="Dactyliosolen fragilissimus" /LENGTH=2479 /DNA_ID=CAMNT_0027365857 /DNA_START=100 /DNA_END=7536 /DNA_ORIENTATION=+
MSFSKNNGTARVFGQTVKRSRMNSSSDSSNLDTGSGNPNSNGPSQYQRQMGNSAGGYGAKSSRESNTGNNGGMGGDSLKRSEARAKRREEGEVLDARFGFDRYHRTNGEGATRRGWIFNMLPTTLPSTEDGNDEGNPDSTSGGPERAGLDLYFLADDGSTFKSTVLHDPYFYVIAEPPHEDTTPHYNTHQHQHDSNNYNHNYFGDNDDHHHHHHNNENGDENDNDNMAIFYETLITTLMRFYEALGLRSVQKIRKHDLDAVNHLGTAAANGKLVLKLLFDTVTQLTDVRRELQSIIQRNQNSRQEENNNTSYTNHNTISHHTQHDSSSNPLQSLVDMREYDVPYLVRVCTDLNIRSGAWYTVTPNHHDCGVTLSQMDVTVKANPTFLAFDIECTKAPLKFPDASCDSIFMISYMVNDKGYLILSRHIVGEDVPDFEYTPKPQYPGPFHIFNEETEEDLIRRFFSEWQNIKPHICVTYNGDFFDWPFLQKRAALYGLDIYQELGIIGGPPMHILTNNNTTNNDHNDKHTEKQDSSSFSQPNDKEYRGRCCVHLDAFAWVKRDSYLPQGAQGLKAVTKYKLGYDPVEVDPEDMVHYARTRPVHMASYSVSDAVATYYLYEKYVHMFIFSLCTIIPMGPEDVLRKGSGTLCEALLMVEACTKDILCPNKQIDPLAKFHDGHLLESETYIGGKVECLETGVYRSDIDYKFDLVPSAFQTLIDNIDRDLTFAIEVEGGLDRGKIVNYDDIRSQIIERLEMLRDRPSRVEKPYVYHLDVGAMYPNIILTNRLQPNAIVDDATCAACDFNHSKYDCKRKMDWVWRGDYNPSTKSEYNRARDQLSRERFDNGLQFHDFSEKEQALMISTRLKQYAKNAYKKTKVTEEVTRIDTVCMRENDFYVDTVRQFRDRRYEYKKLTKTWGKKAKSAKEATAKKDAEDRATVFDSLQIAHKCILNSFYGYVMRKGARWRSMEMAGIVTKTGADLITQARKLVEQIGRPLELDTDGIWCILPKSFPDNYFFQHEDGSTFKLEYPCIMLNADVHNHFTNHQYQTLKGDPSKRIYETRSECSIFFEVDGPYRCMVLPASTEEGRLLKKRYAVFNHDGSLAELKGFELKRRGELELIKTFQSQVFERFLDGSNLEECYSSVADIANHWIDVLDTQGEMLDTEELVELISENRNMSRQLEDYGDQKGTSQTTARRLGEFLGADIIKDKGLNCKFIIAERPYGAPVTERAIPTAIWKAEDAVMKHHLRKWLKSPGIDGDELDVRSVLDWDYYRDRLGKTIMKIITIPAALQNITNPVPRISHPEWLEKTVRRINDKYKQRSITSMFMSKPTTGHNTNTSTIASKPVDMEDMVGGQEIRPGRPLVHKARRIRSSLEQNRTVTNHSSIEDKIHPDSSTSITSSEGNAKHSSLPSTSPSEVALVTPPKVVLSKDTFQSWLARKKQVWNFKARRKLLQKSVHNSSANKFSGSRGQSISKTMDTKVLKQRRAPGSMEGYIRNATQALTSNNWHIVEIRELSATEGGSDVSSSGEFILWVMLGNSSLQKVQLSVPRTVFVNFTKEVDDEAKLVSRNADISVKRVEKHLPHNKGPNFLYEVSLPDNMYRKHQWWKLLFSSYDAIESVYESKTPLLLRSLVHLGCLSKVNPSADARNGKFMHSDLKRVNPNSDDKYLHSAFSYKKIFIYECLNDKSKSGIISVFLTTYTSSDGNDSHDISDPQSWPKGTFKPISSCHVWIVKPGGDKGQKNITKRSFEMIFTQLLKEIGQHAEDKESEYSCMSHESLCSVENLSFVETAADGFMGVNDVLNTYVQGNNGPTFLLLNCSKTTSQLRKTIPNCNSFPLVNLPFPPGPAHNPSLSTLPALNWEPVASQYCLEAYLYMSVVSYPTRIKYSRYGNIPIGNLGVDATIMSYDVIFSRLLQKNRALLWANTTPGSPDVGLKAICDASDSKSSSLILDTSSGCQFDSNDIWGDEKENVSPVVRNPGAYRNICVEVDIHDLSIASLVDTKSQLAGMVNASSDQSGGDEQLIQVVNNGAGDGLIAGATPLGDEMSTAMSLQLLRALAQSWLRDASEFNSGVADELLSHFYRLVSTPDAWLSDPALHRVLHSLMKSTFCRLLSEFRRLGSKIICANFHKIIIATNKSCLSEAKEYVNFVISTIQKRSSSSSNDTFDGLRRISLRPNNFYSHYLFLDEHNFGGILYETSHTDADMEQAVVPTVVSGWNIMHYLPSEKSQEYFRAIIAKFSSDVHQKQLALESEEGYQSLNDIQGKILTYKKSLVSKHFANYLTSSVSEIIRDGDGKETFAILPGSHLSPASPELEFIKSVMVIFELDIEVDYEVQRLKRSLLSQIGVQEYASETKWVNPCSSFILPDVFCVECHESRDVDLCMLPLHNDEDVKTRWMCEDCATPYDTSHIEQRLIDIVERKVIRYQLQDLRCSKSGMVAIRCLSQQSDSSQKLKADISRKDMNAQFQILRNLAKFYELEW